MATASDRRIHTRIAVPLNVRIVLGTEEKELQVRDISIRGIYLYVDEAPGNVGDSVPLKLAITAGIKPLLVKAEIVRVEKTHFDNGIPPLGVAMRFLELDAPKETAIIDLLDRAMLGRGTRMRSYPRVYRLIEVKCRTRVDARALMKDIGEGGIGLVVEQWMEPNEEVMVEITRPGESPMRLPGWVVACAANKEKPNSFQVGVRFARIPPPVRRELQLYLKKLYRKT